jgi:hypothetical protein
MTRQPFRLSRWSLRRSMLGVALALHVMWLTLAAPLASAHQAGRSAMPCHEAMMLGAMDQDEMAGMSMAAVMPDHHSGPTPLKTAPANLPCCAQNCACAASLCAMTAAALHNVAAVVRYELALSPIPMPPSREPTPELRPPILH